MWHWTHPDLLLPLSVGVGNSGHHNVQPLQNADQQKEQYGVYFYLPASFEVSHSLFKLLV